MKKLLYILPEYDRNAHTHFSYIPEFLEKLAPTLDILLLVERGDVPIVAGVKSKRAGFFAICSAFFSGYRVCYVHYSFKSACIASLTARVFGGKVFYWNCGLPWEYTKSALRDGFERVVYRLVTYVVTGTERLAEEYARVYRLPRSKVLVMPNWIDTKSIKYQVSSIKGEEIRKELGIEAGHEMVLFAHRLSPRKGAQYLPEIARAFSDTVFIVCGDGPLRPLLEGIPNIRLMGWQSHDVVLGYMRSASLFITPSDEEGFPHVLLEAMALGVPFVATAVGGVPEIVPPTVKENLIQKGDMPAFIRAMRALLSDIEKRNDMQKETTTWVAQYDTSVVLKRFCEIIEI